MQKLTLLADACHAGFLRSDKEARECHTDQLGVEKAALVAQARPIHGITLR